MTIRSVAATLSALALVFSPLSSSPSQSFAQTRADNEPQQVFNNACRTCHTIREGDNRLGPNLFKVIGRPAGSLPDYNYSSAMKDAGFIWDETNLAHFIASPDEVVPGNKMQPYGGLGSEDAEKVVVFLRSISPR